MHVKYAVWHVSYSASNTLVGTVFVPESNPDKAERDVDFFTALRAGRNEFALEIIAPRVALDCDATRDAFAVRVVIPARAFADTRRVLPVVPTRDNTARGATVDAVAVRDKTFPELRLFCTPVVPRKTASEPRVAANAEHVQIAHITIETTVFFISDDIC